MSADLPELAGHPIGDKQAGQRFLAKSIWFTVPGTWIFVGVAYAIVPPLQGLEETGARLVLAAPWLLVAMIPYAAVCMAIAIDRFLEGAHNPLLGGGHDCLGDCASAAT